LRRGGVNNWERREENSNYILKIKGGSGKFWLGNFINSLSMLKIIIILCVYLKKENKIIK